MQVCEKEMKIKAFSKEGLQAPQKDNPQERAKTEMRDNINKQVEQLETQVQLHQSISHSLLSSDCHRLCTADPCCHVTATVYAV